jgi:MFS family permease
MASSVAAPALAIRSKPRLTFWEIWNMSFGFLGIQIGFALQNANVSRIFETLGAKVENIPLLWIAAPVTGLLIQPIVGYLSDRTWNRLGRRRPYFLTGAILASAALDASPLAVPLRDPYSWKLPLGNADGSSGCARAIAGGLRGPVHDRARARARRMGDGVPRPRPAT